MSETSASSADESNPQPTPPVSPEDRRALYAYIGPFAIFMLGLAAVSVVQSFAGDSEALFLSEPKYWIYPLQSIACGIALIYWWKNYDFGAQRGFLFGTVIGVLVLALWISPQWLLGFDPRLDGFDPTLFEEDPGMYWGTVLARFFRLVIIVPIVEEVFWRGFLMRYLIRENFTSVPFGQYTHLSFWGVTVAFALAHWGPDFIAALITGALFGWVAIRTKSLTATILAHAVTNLLLGLYIMRTAQWGFW